MHPSELTIKEYTYDLPPEKIALYPLPARDQSRLLIYQQQNISESFYQQLPNLLPEHNLLVFNQTKVVPARLIFYKPSGGKIEVFCLAPDERYADLTTGMQQKNEVYWQCLVGGAAKWKPGQELALIGHYEDEHGELQSLTVKATLTARNVGHFVLRIFWEGDLSFAAVLQHAGAVPLPPYLHREEEPEDAYRYQTVFAKEEGSVAAPTAALHFTKQMLEQLPQKNIDTAFLTLHVGAGTFKPVQSETMKGHDMHAEWMDCSVDFISRLYQQLSSGNKVVAVGTTSARTLESLYWIGVRLIHGEQIDSSKIAVAQWYPYETDSSIPADRALQAVLAYMQHESVSRLVTQTQIIIAPGYEFKIVDGLLTNFHQPQSTLLLLVAALIGKDWRKVYDYALSHDFRFLSYGDGCLLWRP